MSAFYGLRDTPKGGLAKINGETICFAKTFYHLEQNNVTPQYAPGTIVSRIDDGSAFEIQCSDHLLRVLEWYKVEENKSTTESDKNITDTKTTMVSKVTHTCSKVKMIGA